MGYYKEIREVFRYLKTAKSFPEITFYSENGIYYQNFKGTIKSILTKSDFTILYITSDLNDPVWGENTDRIKPFYINKLIPFVFPFINTKTLILTMADLDRYHVKRSTNPVNHIYMFHAINSTHMQYNEGAFDGYDTIFCVGPHHIKEIRKTEEIYDLPPKELVNIGFSWLEELEKNHQQVINNKKSDTKKILIAPSWNEGNILESCIDVILEKLLPLSYQIVVRPHPEFIKRKKENVKRLQEKFGEHKNFIIEIDSASFRNILESEILITDWSGIAIEFGLGMKKPIIFINTPKKIHNSEYKKLGILPIEDQIRHQLGLVMKPEDCGLIDSQVERLLSHSVENKKTLTEIRNQNIFNWETSSEAGADYIIQYCEGVE